MAKTHTEVVSIRMTPQMLDVLTGVANENNLTTLEGKPNLGAAARILIAAGLDRGDGVMINQNMRANVRSELLQIVNAHTKMFVAALTRDLGE